VLFQSEEEAVFIVDGGDSYELFVDGVSVCTAANVEMAIGLCFAAFYIFNLKFPEHTTKMLVFMQKFAFEIEERTADQYIIRAQRASISLVEKLTRKAHKSAGAKKQVTTSQKVAVIDEADDGDYVVPSIPALITANGSKAQAASKVAVIYNNGTSDVEADTGESIPPLATVDENRVQTVTAGKYKVATGKKPAAVLEYRSSNRETENVNANESRSSRKKRKTNSKQDYVFYK